MTVDCDVTKESETTLNILKINCLDRLIILFLGHIICLCRYAEMSEAVRNRCNLREDLVFLILIEKLWLSASKTSIGVQKCCSK